MSANNLTSCPECKKQRQHQIECLERGLTEIYGKVSAKEYERASSELTELKVKHGKPGSGYTLAEYYEIGVRGERFKVSYYARCSECEWEYEHKLEQPLESEAPDE